MKKLHYAFVDLDKAFDWVPLDVVWWEMCKLGVKEVVNGTLHEEFNKVKVGVPSQSFRIPSQY